MINGKQIYVGIISILLFYSCQQNESPIIEKSKIITKPLVDNLDSVVNLSFKFKSTPYITRINRDSIYILTNQKLFVFCQDTRVREINIGKIEGYEKIKDFNILTYRNVIYFLFSIEDKIIWTDLNLNKKRELFGEGTIECADTNFTFYKNSFDDDNNFYSKSLVVFNNLKFDEYLDTNFICSAINNKGIYVITNNYHLENLITKRSFKINCNNSGPIKFLLNPTQDEFIFIQPLELNKYQILTYNSNGKEIKRQFFSFDIDQINIAIEEFSATLIESLLPMFYFNEGYINFILPQKDESYKKYIIK